jgi:hypothetical protein
MVTNTRFLRPFLAILEADEFLRVSGTSESSSYVATGGTLLTCRRPRTETSTLVLTASTGRKHFDMRIQESRIMPEEPCDPSVMKGIIARVIAATRTGHGRSDMARDRAIAACAVTLTSIAWSATGKAVDTTLRISRATDVGGATVSPNWRDAGPVPGYLRPSLNRLLVGSRTTRAGMTVMTTQGGSGSRRIEGTVTHHDVPVITDDLGMLRAHRTFIEQAVLAGVSEETAHDILVETTS